MKEWDTDSEEKFEVLSEYRAVPLNQLKTLDEYGNIYTIAEMMEMNDSEDTPKIRENLEDLGSDLMEEGDIPDTYKGAENLGNDLMEEGDIPDIYNGIENLEDLEKNVGDYAYHWDGKYTHNVEWDDDTNSDPTTYKKVLKR